MITYQNMVITLMGYYYLFQAAKFWTSLVSIYHWFCIFDCKTSKSSIRDGAECLLTSFSVLYLDSVLNFFKHMRCFLAEASLH